MFAPATPKLLAEGPVQPPTDLPNLEPLPEPTFAEVASLELLAPPKPIWPVGHNGYYPGECVWGVAMWKPVPDYMGSAYEWDEAARAMGFTVSDIPIVGSVGQTDRGYWGHVVLIIDTRPGEVKLREMNYAGKFSTRERWAPTTEFSDYIYF